MDDITEKVKEDAESTVESPDGVIVPPPEADVDTVYVFAAAAVIPTITGRKLCERIVNMSVSELLKVPLTGMETLLPLTFEHPIIESVRGL